MVNDKNCTAHSFCKTFMHTNAHYSWSDKAPMSPKKTLDVTLVAQVYRIFLAILEDN